MGKEEVVLPLFAINMILYLENHKKPIKLDQWSNQVRECFAYDLQCGKPGFDPCVGKIPWRRAWQPTPVFLPGESPWTEEPGGLQSMGSQSWTRVSD